MNNKLRGLRGTLTKVERAIAANKEDIANGFQFEHFLRENEAKAERLRKKIAECVV